MNKSKYIILPATALTHNIEIPIVFPAALQHAAVALAFHQYQTPVAAGFVFFRNVEDGKQVAICEGESNSLRIKSRGREDAELVEILML